VSQEKGSPRRPLRAPPLSRVSCAFLARKILQCSSLRIVCCSLLGPLPLCAAVGALGPCRRRSQLRAQSKSDRDYWLGDSLIANLEHMREIVQNKNLSSSYCFNGTQTTGPNAKKDLFETVFVAQYKIALKAHRSLIKKKEATSKCSIYTFVYSHIYLFSAVCESVKRYFHFSFL